MAIEDMVKRHTNFDDTKDFIPTPPWATRVLYEEVVPHMKRNASNFSVWDPAMGAGHMVKVFAEYGHPDVRGSDLYSHPRVPNLPKGVRSWTEDFVKCPPTEKIDIIVTNPPYKHLGAFIKRSLGQAQFGVGMLVRVQALESEKRYNEIFRGMPPTKIAFFANRIPFKTGEVRQKAPKMYFHVWLWWQKLHTGELCPAHPPMWIPFDAQQKYEKESDYEC